MCFYHRYFKLISNAHIYQKKVIVVIELKNYLSNGITKLKICQIKNLRNKKFAKSKIRQFVAVASEVTHFTNVRSSKIDSNWICCEATKVHLTFGSARKETPCPGKGHSSQYGAHLFSFRKTWADLITMNMTPVSDSVLIIQKLNRISSHSSLR